MPLAMIAIIYYDILHYIIISYHITSHHIASLYFEKLDWYWSSLWSLSWFCENSFTPQNCRFLARA